MARAAVKSAGWYVVHEGRRLVRVTRAEISRIAQQIADMTGEPVTVRPVKAAAAARPARPRAVLKVQQNPDSDLAYFYQAEQKAQRERLAYVNATKGRRLAKGLRGRDRGGAVKASEAGARKTAKFAVAVRNRKESFTLYRASRRAADDLAAEFKAAGYTVTLSEV